MALTSPFVTGRPVSARQWPMVAVDRDSADKSNYGSFTALDDAARENIRAIIDEAVKNPSDPIAKKVGDFYKSYMNEELINQKGTVSPRRSDESDRVLKTSEAVVEYFGNAGRKDWAVRSGFSLLRMTRIRRVISLRLCRAEPRCQIATTT